MRVTLDADPGLSSSVFQMIRAGCLKLVFQFLIVWSINQLNPNVALLDKIAERTGGEVLEDPTEVFRSHPFKSGEKKADCRGAYSGSNDFVLHRYYFAAIRHVFKGFTQNV